MKNILLATSLMFSVATTAFSIGEQEREVLYTLHTLEQDFSDMPMVKQNIDMFIGVFQMNSQLLEKKLAIANQKTKKTLVKSAALTAGVLLSRSLILFSALLALNCFDNNLATPVELSRNGFLFVTNNVTNAVVAIGNSWTAVSLFAIFKERNALKEALALDQAILEKLLTIKDLAMFSFDGDMVVEATDAHNAVSEVAELE